MAGQALPGVPGGGLMVKVMMETSSYPDECEGEKKMV